MNSKEEYWEALLSLTQFARIQAGDNKTIQGYIDKDVDMLKDALGITQKDVDAYAIWKASD